MRRENKYFKTERDNRFFYLRLSFAGRYLVITFIRNKKNVRLNEQHNSNKQVLCKT